MRRPPRSGDRATTTLTQGATLAAVTEAGAPYVVTLKGDQAEAHAAIRSFFDGVEPEGLRAAGIRCGSEEERSHGPHELRQVWVAPPKSVPSLVARWASAGSVAQVRRTRVHRDGRVEVSTRWYVSSLAPKVSALAKAIHGHWSLENGLHWVLDA